MVEIFLPRRHCQYLDDMCLVGIGRSESESSCVSLSVALTVKHCTYRLTTDLMICYSRITTLREVAIEGIYTTIPRGN